jgi:tetratricopeptide (TPR) repeat protein
MKIKYDFIKDIIKGIAIVYVYMLMIKMIEYSFLLFNPSAKSFILIIAIAIAIAIFTAIKAPFLLSKAVRIFIILGAILGAILLVFRDPLTALPACLLCSCFLLNYVVFSMYRDSHTYINYNNLYLNNSEENNLTLDEDESKILSQSDYSENIYPQDDNDYSLLPYRIGKLYSIVHIIAIALSIIIVILTCYGTLSAPNIESIGVVLYSFLIFSPLLFILIFQNEIVLFPDRAIIHTFWSENTIILFKDIHGIETRDIEDRGGNICNRIVSIIYLTKNREYKVLIPSFRLVDDLSHNGLVLLLLIKLVRKISPHLQLSGIINGYSLNDIPADYNQAIELNPKDAEAYNNRGVLKQTNIHDIQGALADYNKAIELNPQHAYAYYNRGLIKGYNLNDKTGALADYNQAIDLNPQYADAYYNRGNLKKDNLNDKTGAIEDFQEAANLYHEQDNMPSYRAAIDRLKELGVSN